MSERINLQDLSVLLAEKAAITKKEAETFLRECFEVMNEELIKDGLIKIKDLGAFKLLPVEDRESIDVTTGERILIPAHYKVVFTPDKKLAETVNEPFAYFETTEIEEDSLPEKLILPPEEEVSEESEPIPEEEEEEEEEEEAVFEKEPPLEEEKEIVAEEKTIPEVEEETVPENKSTLEEKMEKDVIYDEKALQRYCTHCHYFQSHQTYRGKYHRTRKKLNRLTVLVYILSVLLLAAIGYIVWQPDILKFF